LGLLDLWLRLHLWHLLGLLVRLGLWHLLVRLGLSYPLDLLVLADQADLAGKLEKGSMSALVDCNKMAHHEIY
jgi:hypothetical protein